MKCSPRLNLLPCWPIKPEPLLASHVLWPHSHRNGFAKLQSRGYLMQHRSNIQRLCSPIATGLLLISVGGCSANRVEFVRLASGPTGGFYHSLGQHIGESVQLTGNMVLENQETQGSLQNLQALRDRKVDFAIVQLDVANAFMRQGEVQAVLVLANEQVHVITQANSAVKTLTDLRGQRVAIGTSGSGIHYTATRLFRAANLNIQPDDINVATGIQKLQAGQVAALVYVGSVGASEKLRQQFLETTNLRLIPLSSSLVNYLTGLDPGSYRRATIAAGTYRPTPPLPAQNLSTLSTATVVVTRPDVSNRKVGLLTWAILSNSRKYAQFYPELETGDAKTLLQTGLFYVHAAAIAVFQEGDPREAWIRYLESNNDLQAGLVILLGTSGIGLFLQYWRRERSKKLLGTTTKRINELKELLPHDPQETLRGIEELAQEHRVMFIDGVVSTDVYEEVRQKTQMFTDQCRNILDRQREKFILDTLLLLDDWQETLQTDPEAAVKKLSQIKQQYREMLMADQVDIQAYMEIMELTLISLMTLAPRLSTTAPPVEEATIQSLDLSGESIGVGPNT
jgi:uncharacterized protein